MFITDGLIKQSIIQSIHNFEIPQIRQQIDDYNNNNKKSIAFFIYLEIIDRTWKLIPKPNIFFRRWSFVLFACCINPSLLSFFFLFIAPLWSIFNGFRRCDDGEWNGEEQRDVRFRMLANKLLLVIFYAERERSEKERKRRVRLVELFFSQFDQWVSFASWIHSWKSPKITKDHRRPTYKNELYSIWGLFCSFARLQNKPSFSMWQLSFLFIQGMITFFSIWLWI